MKDASRQRQALPRTAAWFRFCLPQARPLAALLLPLLLNACNDPGNSDSVATAAEGIAGARPASAHGAPFPIVESANDPTAGRVVVTWYGVATLLFDDGATKVLIDGFFSRPALDNMAALAAPDIDQITRMIQVAKLSDLAAITPVHSHFDHAMDLGEIARRTGAVVLGSPSTANIARGAGVAAAKIHSTDSRMTRQFGDFTLTLVRSAHAPLVDGGPPMPGTIDKPLVPPVAISDWKEGGSYSIVVAHPGGTAIVQGSAGFVVDALAEFRADVVFLGVGGLSSLGQTHARKYYQEVVGKTQADCIFGIHWDDFTKPFGTIASQSDGRAEAWLRSEAARADPRPAFYTLPFGAPVDVFANSCSS